MYSKVFAVIAAKTLILKKLYLSFQPFWKDILLNTRLNKTPSSLHLEEVHFDSTSSGEKKAVKISTFL